jgi:hypothetical protein
MVEANAGMNQAGILENTLPDPVKPLRWFARTVYLMIAVLLALAWLIPQYAFVYIGMMIPVSIGWYYALRQIKIEEEDYFELFKNRADFSLFVPPIHPEDAALKAADLLLPKAKRKGTWVRHNGPSACPEIVDEQIFRPDGSVGNAKYWRYKLTEKSRPDCQAMGKYLREHCPKVYAVVTAWWEELHANKVAGQIWIGKLYKNLSPDDKKLVRQRCEFELYQGIFIGLRTDTWGKRYDSRPYFKTFYDLRVRLDKNIPLPDWPSQEIIDAAPWPETFRVKWVYNGKGFTIDEELAAKYYFQKHRKVQPAKHWLDTDKVRPRFLYVIPLIGPWLAHSFRSLRSKISKRYRLLKKMMLDAAGDTGARWILGSGWRKIESLWLHYDRDMAQHTLVGGGSGYGKTVLLQSAIVSAVYNYSALTWLDPKVDKSTVSLIVYHAFMAGRMDDLCMLSVSRSECPYNSTMNPLSGYFDPSQIGNILAGLMPESAGDNQYFLDDARNIGRIVGTVVHWIGDYLTHLSGGNEVCRHPPKLLLWLEYARVNNLHVIEEKEVSKGSRDTFTKDRGQRIDQVLKDFNDVFSRLLKEDRDFIPRDTAEKSLYGMWIQVEYSARYWKVNFSHLLEFALNNRQRLVSWVMRLVYPHVCARDERFQDPMFPKFDTLELVTGFIGRGARPPGQAEEKPAISLLQLYEHSGPHILSKDGLKIADRTATLWSYLYERIINVEDVEKIQYSLVRMDRIYAELIGQARRDPEEYGQGVANLRPVVQEIVAGEKFDKLCVPEPDLTWPKIHKEKKIVLLILGSMSDQKASDAVSKAFVQSLLGYCGYIQDRGAQDLDLTFAGDEFFSWATSTWAHIVDKCRSTGVRTMVACQSEAGMRYALKSPDLFKHIVASVRNNFTCATSSSEDHKSFIEGVRKINIYTPVRTLGETPTMAGDDSPGVGFSGWGTNESWQFNPQAQPLVDPEMVGWLPKGCFFRRIQGEFAIFQAPLLKPAPFLFHDLVGLTTLGTKKDQRQVLVEGVDYSVEDLKDLNRMATWASKERLASVFGLEDAIDPDSLKLPEKATMTDGYRLIPMDLDGLGGGNDTDHQNDVALVIDDDDVGFDPDAENELRCAVQSSIEAVGKDIGLTAAEVVENGLVGRGALDANGLRFGSWQFYREGTTLLVLDGFYREGLRHGEWNERNAEGGITKRHQYANDLLVSDQALQPAEVSDVQLLPPGPLPKPELKEYKDSEGFRYCGLMRNDTRLGMWEVFRPNGTRSEIQHFNMQNGDPTGLWERYDEFGDLIESYSPID